MAKKKIKKLRGKIRKLKSKLRELESPSGTSKVSALAPPDGFPELPVIDGVRFAALETGIRYKGRPDVMLAELCPGTAIAGVFTKSSTRAAPVLDCQKKLGGPQDGGAAILVNAGNANAFTGTHGLTAVDALTNKVADVLNIDPMRVFSSSTGVIGETLPHERIAEKITQLGSLLDASSAELAAHAILTTDTFPKGASATVPTDNGSIKIAGFAKGSGMIAPDMATMLVYIFTDANITQSLLQEIVSEASEQTFNCITVDSDTSTSDTLLVAATGRSDSAEITNCKTGAGLQFKLALHGVMQDLAHQVVRDGEGASKFIEINVKGAKTDFDAKTIALSIANSPLVKTAFAGEDPNWGRIVMAIGKSGAQADRDRISIHFGDILVAEKGWVAESYTEDAGAVYMKQQDLSVTVNLNIADGAATVWTCDFSKRYIEINADYRS